MDFLLYKIDPCAKQLYWIRSVLFGSFVKINFVDPLEKLTPVLRHWLAPSFLFLLDIKCVYIGRNGEGSVKVVGCRVERTKMAKYLKSFFVHFIGNPWVWVWFSVWVRAIWMVCPRIRPRPWLCCCWLGCSRVCFRLPFPWPLEFKCGSSLMSGQIAKVNVLTFWL